MAASALRELEREGRDSEVEVPSGIVGKIHYLLPWVLDKHLI